MRTLRTAAVATFGLAVALGACTADRGDVLRAGVEDGFEQAGIDVTDEQSKCVADSITEQLGGEERLEELEEDYDSVEDLPEEIREEFAQAGITAFADCDIDVTGAG
ncbi:MAG: hypothetical protein AB7L84_09735 [Acidimicrobiia bacterium]